MMDREEIVQKIQEGLGRMKKWDINTYRSDSREMNALNPAFGFRETDNSNNLSRSKGVMNVWMGGGAKDITVHILPRGFGGPDKDLKMHDLTDEQLQSIFNLVDGLCQKEIQGRKQAAMNPKLEEILPRLEFWSKRCAAAAGPQYSAFVSLGKRAFDKEKYHAIVIYENNDQIGSISLKQLEDGRLTYNERTLLGGQWMSDETLNIRNIMMSIRDSIATITGRKVELDAEMPQRQLMDEIRRNNRKWADSGMTLDLQVKRGEAMIPERWKINFNHQFVSDNHVALRMTGTRADADNSATYVIASGTYNPQKTGEWLLMEGNGEQAALLMALIEADKIEEVDYRNTPSHGKWLEVDAKELYTDWLRGKNIAYLFSPIDKIQLVVMPNSEKENGFTNAVQCEFGGLPMEPHTVSKTDAELLRAIADKPQYAFLEQMIAHKAFSARLNEYYANRNRISDIRISENGNRSFIRCRIDGEMQLRQQIPGTLQKVLKGSGNKDATLIVLAENIFRGQLDTRQLDRTMKL